MSRIARVTAGALVAATAFAVAPAPASAELPPECTVVMEGRRFAGPGGGTWYVQYPVVTCTL